MPDDASLSLLCSSREIIRLTLVDIVSEPLVALFQCLDILLEYFDGLKKLCVFASKRLRIVLLLSLAADRGRVNQKTPLSLPVA